MTITPFGIVILLIIGSIFMIEKNAKSIFKALIVLMAVCTLNIRMGFFLRVGENSISYGGFFIYFISLYSIFMLGKTNNISARFFRVVCIFDIILFLQLAVNLISPYKGSIIQGGWQAILLGNNYQSFATKLSIDFLQIGLYITLFGTSFIFLATDSVLLKNDWKVILHQVFVFSKFSILIGFIELFVKNIFNTTIITEFFINIFGEYGAQQNDLTLRGGLYAVQGATKEASMFTTVIFYIAIMCLVDYINYPKRYKSNVVYFLACLILLAINPALSSAIYILILLAVLFVHGFWFSRGRIAKHSFKRFIFLGFIFVLGITVIFNLKDVFLSSEFYIIQRIGKSIQQIQAIFLSSGDFEYSSEGIRFFGIYYDLQMFLRRSILGYGLGILNCNSGIVTFLVSGGIVLFISWFSMIYCFSSKPLRSNTFVFLIVILILPSMMLNDYETIFCIIIPIIAKNYAQVDYGREKERRSDVATNASVSYGSYAHL